MKTLDELDRLEKAATAGHWFYDHNGKPECELESLDDKDVPHGDIWFRDEDGHRTAVAESIWWDGADGELIAAMRNNIRALIEVARAAENYFTEDLDSGIDMSPKWFRSYKNVTEALGKLE
jgi:hypothetical protein